MGALNAVPPASVKPPHLPAPQHQRRWAEISISVASHANRIVIWEYNKALGAKVNK